MRFLLIDRSLAWVTIRWTPLFHLNFFKTPGELNILIWINLVFTVQQCFAFIHFRTERVLPLLPCVAIVVCAASLPCPGLALSSLPCKPCGPAGFIQLTTAQNPRLNGSDKNAYRIGFTHELPYARSWEKIWMLTENGELGYMPKDLRTRTTCMGSHDNAKITMTIKTIRMTLFLLRILSAEAWPPGACRHNLLSMTLYMPQINSRGKT